MMRQRRDGESRAEAAGFTIVEAMIAISVFFVVVLIICQLFAVSAQIFLLSERQRNAEAQVGAVANWLASLRRANLAGGQDQVIVPVPGREPIPALPVGCTRWPCAIAWGPTTPDGTQVLFARRWTVNAIDDRRNLLQVTISIFESTTSVQPLVARTTNVVPQ